MDDDLIKSWEDSNITSMNIAADMAIGIERGRIKSVPAVAEIAQEWDVSTWTVRQAWKLLGDSGIFKRDVKGRYYLP